MEKRYQAGSSKQNTVWGCEGVAWIQLAHDNPQCQALVSTVVNFPDFMKGGELLGHLSDYQILKRSSDS
jgi:hypothetical protein